MFYACKDKYEAIKSLNLAHLQPIDAELDILSDLAERIVPLRGIPALQEHSSLPFILKIVNDCYPAKLRDKFRQGYQQFVSYAAEKLGKPYADSSDEEKMGLLHTLNVDETKEETQVSDALALFRILKSEGINYLVNTEYLQRNVRYYQMAPGGFEGCVVLADIQNPNDKK